MTWEDCKYFVWKTKQKAMVNGRKAMRGLPPSFKLKVEPFSYCGTKAYSWCILLRDSFIIRPYQDTRLTEQHYYGFLSLVREAGERVYPPQPTVQQVLDELRKQLVHSFELQLREFDRMIAGK